MPVVATPDNAHHFFEKYPNIPPYTAESDDPYGNIGPATTYLSVPTSSNPPPIPSIIVARMPGSTAAQIDTMLTSAVNRHKSPNTQVMLSTVSAQGLSGGLDPFSPWGTITNQFASAVYGGSCSSTTPAPGCLSTAIETSVKIKNPGSRNQQELVHENSAYCITVLLSGMIYSCTDRGTFVNDMSSTYGVQVYVCGGNGEACHSAPNNQYEVVSSSDMPQLNTNPVIFSFACYSSILDQSFLNWYDNANNEPSVAEESLIHGAAAYVGSTEETEINWGGPVLNEVGIPAHQTQGTTPEIIQVYLGFRSGQTIGQAFLAMKQQYEASGVPMSVTGAQEMQLYGDPTLTS